MFINNNESKHRIWDSFSVEKLTPRMPSLSKSFEEILLKNNGKTMTLEDIESYMMALMVSLLTGREFFNFNNLLLFQKPSYSDFI